MGLSSQAKRWWFLFLHACGKLSPRWNHWDGSGEKPFWPHGLFKCCNCSSLGLWFCWRFVWHLLRPASSQKWWPQRGVAGLKSWWNVRNCDESCRCVHGGVIVWSVSARNWFNWTGYELGLDLCYAVHCSRTLQRVGYVCEEIRTDALVFGVWSCIWLHLLVTWAHFTILG